MAAAIDGGDMKGIGQAIEGEATRQLNDMAAIDQPPAEPAFTFDKLIEMDARGILIEPGRHHMLGLFDGDAVDMVDALANLIIAEAINAAGQCCVVSGNVDRRGSFAPKFRVEH